MTITHTAAFAAGGSVAHHQDTRYANDSRVAQDGGVFTVTAPDATYQVHRCGTTGWGVYRDDGVDLLPVAGDGFATGIATADQAIGALIGDARG